MKSVVIYYSLEGNTDLVAKMIAERIGADRIRLKPEKDIQSTGASKYLLGGKGVMLNERPKLTNGEINLDQYDTLIIGTPIWASSFTPPLTHFFPKIR